jgi:uncharacterized membrane protein YeaQ/YmgE (transglycosylase-associated protein family)
MSAAAVSKKEERVFLRAIIVGIVGAGVTAWIGWSPWIPDPLAYHSVWLAAIGAIYLGFAFADGRLSILLIEMTVATGFIVLAFLGLWQAPLFITVGLVLHGLWDLAHRPRGVTTRLPVWYPAFCAAFDFVFAGVFFVLARDLAARGA